MARSALQVLILKSAAIVSAAAAAAAVTNDYDYAIKPV